MPFEQIAVIVGAPRTGQDARQPRPPTGAGATAVPDADLARQREVVDAFFAAARGDFEALVGVLDPDVVVRADAGAVPVGAWRGVRGAAAVAEQVRTTGGFVRRAGFISSLVMRCSSVSPGSRPNPHGAWSGELLVR